MAIDFLKYTLDKIEGWCIQNNVAIFYGEIEENKSTEIKWMTSGNSDWEKYLNVLKSVQQNILALTVRKNNFDDSDELISGYLETSDENEQEEYRSALTPVKQNMGQIAYYILTFFNENKSQEGFENFRDTYRISSRAEEIFETEIKPQQDAALRIQVLELKAKGMKKIEFSSKLKISRDAVNNYYYSEND